MVTFFDLVILTFRNVAFLLFLIFSTKTYSVLKNNLKRGLKTGSHYFSRYNKLSDKHAECGDLDFIKLFISHHI